MPARWDQTGCSDFHWLIHPIEDVNEGQRVVALQRHCGVHSLLGCQHRSEGLWELPGSYINGHELREEGIFERWNISKSARKLWISQDCPKRTVMG